MGRAQVAAILAVVALSACGGQGEAEDDRSPAADDARTTEAAETSAPASEAATPEAVEASEADTAGEPTDATAEFIAQADQRCQEAFAQLDAIEYPTELSLSANAASFEQVAAINRSLIADVGAMEVPEPDRETVDGILDAASVSIDALDEAIAAAAAEDLAGFDEAITRMETLTLDVNQRAAAYGFESCFQPPS